MAKLSEHMQPLFFSFIPAAVVVSELSVTFSISVISETSAIFVTYEIHGNVERRQMSHVQFSCIIRPLNLSGMKI